MIKKVLVSCFVFWGLAAEVAVAAETTRYPLINQWQGKAWVTGREGKKELLTRKTVLHDKALIETSDKAQVKILLDKFRSVTVLSSSEVSLPVISWESGEAPVIFLRSGELLWEQGLASKGSYNTALRSDLFEFIAPAGEYIVAMSPSRAFAEVRVFTGSLNFSAMNGEESVTVKSGQRAGFQGVLEEGEVAYDVLLKGKKIPKGRLSAVTAIDAKELTARAGVDKKREQALKQAAEKRRQSELKTQVAGAICKTPEGRFNQCSWKFSGIKESRICVRYRCNANGEWADAFELNAEKGSTLCKSQPVVGPCDY